MSKYKNVPEELIERALDYCVKANKGFQGLSALEAIEYLHSMTAVKIGKEILESQQTKKPVDMSVLVDSGLLCEFSQNTQFVGAPKRLLSSIKNDRYNAAEWKYCRPLCGHWHSAKNFDDVSKIVIGLRNAGFNVEYNGNYKSFRITGLQYNYCMPWEV